MIGRPATFKNKREVVKVLRNEKVVTYYHMRQLVKNGYFDVHEEVIEGVKRGRRRHLFVVAKRGKALLNLAKNWDKASEINEVAEDILNGPDGPAEIVNDDVTEHDDNHVLEMCE